MAIDVKLPPLGDNIESGDVLEVKVHEGDVIERDQGILEIETDKATVEVPSTHAGKVLKVHVKDGQTIPIGAALITVEEVASAAKPAAGPGAGRPSAAQPQSAAQPAEPADKPVRQPPPAPAEKPTPPPSTTPRHDSRRVEAPPQVAASAAPSPNATPPAIQANFPESSGGPIAAGPSVRRFAREVGVDLNRVTGSGPAGRITRDDVLAVVRTANEVARTRSTSTEEIGKESEEPTQRDAWGAVRYEKLSKIRKTIAMKMADSWSSAPRVTNFDDADVTELDRIRQSSRDDYAVDGIKLTSLPFVIKAAAMSLRKHAAINASLDLEQDQVVYKQYVHIGVAVDTDRGLVVPVVRHADRLSIPEIARQVATLAENMRSGNFSVDDLRGGTFTISNLGAVGGTYSTPMINVPEVAILLLGRSRKMPVVVDDQVVVRLMMPLSLSYDHRLVDGAAAARFLNELKGLLEAPGRLLLAP